MKKGPSYLRSAFLAYSVGYEMLLRAGQNVPSRLQITLDNTIFALTKHRRVIEAMSDLQLTSAWSTKYRQQWQDLSEMFSQEIEPEPLCFLVLSLDNLDLTNKGANATNESWVVSNLDSIPPGELFDVGFLQPDP